MRPPTHQRPTQWKPPAYYPSQRRPQGHKPPRRPHRDPPRRPHGYPPQHEPDGYQPEFKPKRPHRRPHRKIPNWKNPWGGGRGRKRPDKTREMRPQDQKENRGNETPMFSPGGFF